MVKIKFVSLLFCHATYLHYGLSYSEASNAMISSLVWDFTHGRMVVCYRRFGTIYWSHLQKSSIPVFLHCLTFEDGADVVL
jgi:hypothetical protein